MRRSIALLAVASLGALSAVERPNLTGTWRVEGAASDLPEVLRIELGEDTVKLSTLPSARASVSIDCGTRGKECKGIVNGEPVKVSYWYNGPVLVEMLFEGEKGERVTKTRRSVSPDGQRLTVEILPIVPASKAPTKAVYVRQQEGSPEESPTPSGK